MTRNRTTTSAAGSNSKWQSSKDREAKEEGEEDETEAASTIQKSFTKISKYDDQSIPANKDSLRPLFEIVLEKKIAGKAEPVGLVASPQMKMGTANSPLKETQKREPGGSSTRMENLLR